MHQYFVNVYHCNTPFIIVTPLTSGRDAVSAHTRTSPQKQKTHPFFPTPARTIYKHSRLGRAPSEHGDRRVGAIITGHEPHDGVMRGCYRFTQCARKLLRGYKELGKVPVCLRSQAGNEGRPWGPRRPVHPQQSCWSCQHLVHSMMSLGVCHSRRMNH